MHMSESVFNNKSPRQKYMDFTLK